MTAGGPDIHSRRDLFDHLEEQMNRSYRQVLDTGRLERETTYVKTYLLEFDWDPGTLSRAEQDFLAQALSARRSQPRPSRWVPQVKATHEDGFYILDWPRRSGDLRLYLDTMTDPTRRFWIAYSLADVRALDRLLDRLSVCQPSFDRVWLWPEMLKDIQDKGDFRGVGLDYDYRRFEAKEGGRELTNYFKVQIWGGPDTKSILDFIGATPQYANRMVLSKVRLKYRDGDADGADAQGQFVLEDVKYNGKFTTRGTSFSSHQSLVTSVREKYAAQILQIERDHTVRRAVDRPAGIEGDPIIFNLEKAPIKDLDLFCEVVFSSYLPFRLWGMVERFEGENEGRAVTAVDLHTGSKLFFEVYHDAISMYLYPGSCGNTAARFYTNLQHTFSRVVTGEDSHGSSIF
jgi:hypothetical protein